jgi:enoyl-CoA hydratase/carnithine racemase
MKFTCVLLEIAEGVATVTLNRPDKLNAITRKMLIEAAEAIEAAERNKSVGVIVLTGAGRAFSAGVDLTELGGKLLEKGGVGGYLDEPARELIREIQTVSKPVIAKINGHCYTGALELALACDLVVCAQDAKLGDTHTKWGLRPSWGMSARLPAAVGYRRARELSFTARTFTGAEAAAWGLANRAVPAAELDAAVRELAGAMLQNSRGAIAAYKALYNKGARRDEKKAVEFEEETQFDINDTNERLAQFKK